MKLVISASPHIDSGATTRKIMGDVLIALLPALIAAVIIFGWRALLVTAVCAAACVFFEWGFEKLCRKPSTIDDLSAVVTGVILAYNLPVSIPLWQAVFAVWSPSSRSSSSSAASARTLPTPRSWAASCCSSRSPRP